jgi:nitroreductase
MIKYVYLHFREGRMIEELIRNSRSFRRFHQDEVIFRDTLERLVDLGRLSPSAANLQPLKYIISSDPKKNEAIFSCLAWAGYLKDWPGPEEGERPPAYIIVLGDTGISKNFGCDHGIAVQSILLGAREMGLGGCIIGSIKRERLRELLEIPERYEILLVLAIGRPKEEVVIEEVKEDGSIRYWRDEKGVHHVPKRRLEEIIIGSY